MTLAEFYRATGVELSLVASDSTDAKLLVFANKQVRLLLPLEAYAKEWGRELMRTTGSTGRDESGCHE